MTGRAGSARRQVATVLSFLTLLLPGGALLAVEPQMVQLTERPPNIETSLEFIDRDGVFTQNDHFFTRSHLANIPNVDKKSWRLELKGSGLEKPRSFTLAQLQHDFTQVEVIALAYCSGNRRGLVEPHVPGVQWTVGAMGNARWRGVRLKDILRKVGLKPDAAELVFDGADGPVIEKTPDFRKSLPVAKALDENTLIAFEMNGKPLPQQQGFPARLVVPGWTATYWVKFLISIEASIKPFDGYWMKNAYRVPKGKFPGASFPSQDSAEKSPITSIVVNSVISNVKDGQWVQAGTDLHVRGYAWDDGAGIKKVEISPDDGHAWVPAVLDKDYGRFSWRGFHSDQRWQETGEKFLLVRATNEKGLTQSTKLTPNPGGYHYNLVQRLKIEVGNGPSKDPQSPSAAVAAPPQEVFLKEAPGRDMVLGHCQVCHSIDYIPMNAHFLGESGWRAEIDKMINKYGAPIPKEDVTSILNYLAKNY